MSSSCCVAYIGLQFDIQISELESLESKSDARQVAAKSVGLETYWANFGGSEERYVLFVGSKLAVLGPEDSLSVQVSSERLLAIFSDTAARLKSIGMSAPVTLNLEWLVDS